MLLPLWSLWHIWGRGGVPPPPRLPRIKEPEVTPCLHDYCDSYAASLNLGLEGHVAQLSDMSNDT